MNQSSPWTSVAEMIRRVSSGQGRERTGLYAIEGTRLIERALRAGAPLAAVLTTERFAAGRHGSRLVQGLRDGVPLIYAPDEVLAELTEGRDLGQILGLVRLPKRVTLEQVLTASDRLPAADQAETMSSGLQPATDDPERSPSRARPPAPALLLAAVDIADPGNVGALARTAHAGGAAALLVAGASDPFHPRATRISRGSVFKLPIVRYRTARDLVDDLARSGVAAVATTATGGTALPDLVVPDGPVAVLLGNEARGLPPDIAASADERLTIPMAAGVDSYSVNAAAAIILYALSHSRAAGERSAGDEGRQASSPLAAELPALGHAAATGHAD